MSARRGAAGAVALAGAGGLLLAGGATAAWVRQETVRDVGGVSVPDVATVVGTALVGQLVGLGTAAVLVGLGLLVARGRARRALAVLLGLAGVAAAAGVGVGVARALALPGSLAAGPGVAALGTLGVLAGAGLVLRRPAAPPSLPPRYSLDEQDDRADEWNRASVEARER